MERENLKAEKNLRDDIDKFLEGLSNPDIEIVKNYVQRVEFKTPDHILQPVHLMLTMDTEDMGIVVTDLMLGRVICPDQDYLEDYIKILQTIIMYIKEENDNMTKKV